MLEKILLQLPGLHHHLSWQDHRHANRSALLGICTDAILLECERYERTKACIRTMDIVHTPEKAYNTGIVLYLLAAVAAVGVVAVVAVGESR